MSPKGIDKTPKDFRFFIRTLRGIKLRGTVVLCMRMTNRS